MVHPAVEYRLITTAEELSAFVPAWRDLWQRDRQASPFQSAEWLASWWEHFGNSRLRSVVITKDAHPTGFLPFYIFRDPQSSQDQLLPVGVGTTDYLDGIFAAECSREEIAGAVECLCASTAHDLLCVPQLPPHSRLLEAMRSHGSSAAFLSASEGCSRMPAVALPDLPQKIRRNAMYYRNRALRCGALELVQADAANQLQIFEELRLLHGSRWSARGEDGVLADDHVIGWHRQAIPLLAEAGLLRLMALRLRGETIAVLYSLIDRVREERTQYFYITAYSPRQAELRPGTLLIAYAIEQAAREDVTTIDMLRGDEPYKQIWHMEKRPTWCLTRYAERDARHANAAA